MSFNEYIKNFDKNSLKHVETNKIIKISFTDEILNHKLKKTNLSNTNVNTNLVNQEVKIFLEHNNNVLKNKEKYFSISKIKERLLIDKEYINFLKSIKLSYNRMFKIPFLNEIENTKILQPVYTDDGFYIMRVK